MVPWIPTFVVVIPETTVSIIGLVISGFIESRYIGRGPLIANIFFLWQLLLPTQNLDQNFVLYLNASLIFFVIAVYSFASGIIPQMDYVSLHPLFYGLSYGLYSSKTVLAIVLSSLFGWGFGGAVLGTVILWFLAIKYLGHKLPFSS